MDKDITILIAEDDPNDVMLLKLAIRKNDITNPVCVVRDGEGAAVLRVEGYRTVPLPDPLPADIHAPIRSAMSG